MFNRRMAQKAARRQQSGQATVRDIPLPLPLKGLYTKARAASVSNLFASELNNLRSDGVALKLRPAIEWLTRNPTPILQRIPFEFGGASHFIEITAHEARAAGAWITRDFNGRATWATNSANVIIADGLGLPVRYDGAAFTAAAFYTSAALNPAECDGIISHHDRIYLWKTGGDLEFLVSDVGAVQGKMNLYPLGRLGNITGSILSMTSLTVDAGDNMNNVLCILTTTGQMILYEGFDPTDSTDWRLLARVNGAVPVGNRAFAQVGKDAWMLTPQGPISVSQAISEGVLALISDISQPIASDIRALVEEGGADWQMFTAADGSMVLINRLADGEAQQFILYLESRSWATATFPARDWHNLGGTPQFTGTDGRLGRLRDAGRDELITGRWVSSWFQAGGEGAVKYIAPTIVSDGPMTVRLVVLSDKNDTPADIAEAEQTFTLEPEEGGATRLTLSDKIPTDASGSSFQITLEVTARWAEITDLVAGVGS